MRPIYIVGIGILVFLAFFYKPIPQKPKAVITMTSQCSITHKQPEAVIEVTPVDKSSTVVVISDVSITTYGNHGYLTPKNKGRK